MPHCRKQSYVGIGRSFLEEKGWVERIEKKPAITKWSQNVECTVEKPKLNHEQALAIASVNSQTGFACYLLEGIRGTWKD